ncbi:copper homeostasis protein CutC [Trichococcus ilyis]|uniref:PF03932 family protein CutC n=1 Tax=Trichococcus ilyis TaxID=640938 RepID=A0A143Z3F9_9LACT|nr:copper homeostasis protein CutC [Trichococcus ilyis]CZR04463.1 copper homeostasis protein cutc [Trichococcus ilyis]SEJ56279.1 copper homeostasis protein [Trichococcus ilyis]
MLKEACVENFTDIPLVVQRGADRIELCDNLVVGGTTPSIGVIRKSIEYCRDRNIPVIVLIRPRGGDFVYTAIEKEIMLIDLEAALQAGATGVAIGALTETCSLDKPFLEEIVGLTTAGKCECTFHMAFDSVPEAEQIESAEWLAKTGFTRILTHGGPAEVDIFTHVDHLRKIMAASGRISIMPGGGVTKKNVLELQAQLGFKEAHGTKIV